MTDTPTPDDEVKKPPPLTQIPLDRTEALYMSHLIREDMDQMRKLIGLAEALTGPLDEADQKIYNEYMNQARSIRIKMLAVVSLAAQGLQN